MAPKTVLTGRRISAILGLLVGTLLGCAVGCIRPPEAGATGAEEIVEAVLDATAGVETLRFETQVDMKVSGDRSQSIELTVSAVTLGVIDQIRQVMESETTSTLDLPPEVGGRSETTAVSYVVGDVTHIKTSEDGQADRWSSQRLLGVTWDDLNQLGREVKVLGAGQVELVGTQRLQGTDCYVLAVSPDTENLHESLAQLPGQLGLSGEVQADLDQLLQDYSLRLWIARDTHLPIRSETKILLDLDSEATGLPASQGFEMSLDATVRTDFHSYDQPVSIDLPPEAGGQSSS